MMMPYMGHLGILDFPDDGAVRGIDVDGGVFLVEWAAQGTADCHLFATIFQCFFSFPAQRYVLFPNWHAFGGVF